MEKESRIKQPGEKESRDPVWIDKQDILLMFHISGSTLLRWRKKHALPFYRLTGKVFYDRTELFELLKSYKKISGSPDKET